MGDIYLRKMLVFLCLFFTIISISIYLISILIMDNKNISSIKTKEKQLRMDKNNIEFKAGQTIRVRMTKNDNEIIAMDINDYLRGVVASEMPAYYNLEALKAQAIVARTYTYQKMSTHSHGDYVDVCDNFNCCQAFYNKETIMNIWTRRGDDDKTKEKYWDKINKAVVQTENLVATYNGKYIKAFFHASSPIKTESVDQIWGKIYYPYLVSVDNIESKEYKNRNSQIIVPFKKMEEYIIKNINSNFKLEYNGNNICIDSFTTSSRVSYINVCGIKISSEKLRTLFGLKSTMFEMIIENENIIFNVIGYGHGIGLSQVGSDYLASIGMKAEDIIKYYYKGVDVIKLDI